MLDDYLTKPQVEDFCDEQTLKEMQEYYAWLVSTPWEDQPEVSFQDTVDLSSPLSYNRITVRNQDMNTQYKKTLRTELSNLNVELRGWYFNDLCNNGTTSRRIKAGVSRQLSESELTNLESSLQSQFGVQIEAKNYRYHGDTVVVYFRQPVR